MLRMRNRGIEVRALAYVVLLVTIGAASCGAFATDYDHRWENGAAVSE